MHETRSAARLGMAMAAIAALCLAPDNPARAQAPPPSETSGGSISLPPVDVIGVSPVLGSGIHPDKIPANLHGLSGRDIGQTGVADLAGAAALSVAVLPGQADRVVIKQVQAGDLTVTTNGNTSFTPPPTSFSTAGPPTDISSSE